MLDNTTLKLSGVVQLRGGTSTVLKSVNPLLSRREIMVEIDTGKIKIGDGIRRWNDIEYSNSVSQEVAVDLSVTLTEQEITQKQITLPSDCEKVVRVALQGLITEENVDWEFIKQSHTISWNGLEFENIVQANDKILIKYNRR